MRIHDAQMDFTAASTQDVTDRATGKKRKATADELRQRMRQLKYTPTEIDVMQTLRGGGLLSPEQVRALKDQDPNIRIPRAWIKAKFKPGTRNAGPTGTGNEQRPT
jgi:hypothetical protein